MVIDTTGTAKVISIGIHSIENFNARMIKDFPTWISQQFQAGQVNLSY